MKSIPISKIDTLIKKLEYHEEPSVLIDEVIQQMKELIKESEAMIPLSDKEISTIEAALYRFVKDNEIDMSQEFRDECVELYRKFRILEGMPMNLQ